VFDCKGLLRASTTVDSTERKAPQNRVERVKRERRAGSEERADWGAKAEDKQAEWSTAKENNPSAHETKESRARNRNPAALFSEAGVNIVHPRRVLRAFSTRHSHSVYNRPLQYLGIDSSQTLRAVHVPGVPILFRLCCPILPRDVHHA
jgi:hypothetical protein